MPLFRGNKVTRFSGSGAGRGNNPQPDNSTPPKPKGNELDELTGPTMPEGNPITNTPAAYREKIF
jgi:hypothetical protein